MSEQKFSKKDFLLEFKELVTKYRKLTSNPEEFRDFISASHAIALIMCGTVNDTLNVLANDMPPSKFIANFAYDYLKQQKISEIREKIK